MIANTASVQNNVTENAKLLLNPSQRSMNTATPRKYLVWKEKRKFTFVRWNKNEQMQCTNCMVVYLCNCIFCLFFFFNLILFWARKSFLYFRFRGTFEKQTNKNVCTCVVNSIRTIWIRPFAYTFMRIYDFHLAFVCKLLPVHHLHFLKITYLPGFTAKTVPFHAWYTAAAAHKFPPTQRKMARNIFMHRRRQTRKR